jgi:hypothetical protein
VQRDPVLVTGMFGRSSLNLTNKVVLVASLDESTNVVRETHTRDDGCVEVMIKENKRQIMDARSASSPKKRNL